MILRTVFFGLIICLSLSGSLLAQNDNGNLFDQDISSVAMLT